MPLVAISPVAIKIDPDNKARVKRLATESEADNWLAKLESDEDAPSAVVPPIAATGQA
jgi:hypothetical protein